MGPPSGLPRRDAYEASRSGGGGQPGQNGGVWDTLARLGDANATLRMPHTVLPTALQVPLAHVLGGGGGDS